MTSETGGRFKRWFWRPPRPHGEVITDRQVSVLELFYDLVYVAVIGQAAHHLAEHVSVRGVANIPASNVEFDVYLDTDADHHPDLLMYNTRLAESDVSAQRLALRPTVDQMKSGQIDGSQSSGQG